MGVILYQKLKMKRISFFNIKENIFSGCNGYEHHNPLLFAQI